MTIEYLADYPDALPILAEWQHREWGHLRPGDTVEARRARLEGWCNRDRIPLTVVALDDGEVLGSASLIPHDMETRMELTPWMAGVFVGEQYRRKRNRRRTGPANHGPRPGNWTSRFSICIPFTAKNSMPRSAGLCMERTNYREQKVVIMTYVPTRPKP